MMSIRGFFDIKKEKERQRDREHKASMNTIINSSCYAFGIQFNGSWLASLICAFDKVLKSLASLIC